MKRCKRCGHEWLPRVEDPLACPKCKNLDWEGKNTFEEEEETN